MFEYEDAVEFGIKKNKLRVIPMGIDFPEESHNYNENKPLNILFVGRLARVRRVELLIMAAAKLTIPYNIFIVGSEEETTSLAKPGYLSELIKLSEDLGVKNFVNFTGAIGPKELPSFYRNADVFVYPSLYENFGQPILEAAAAGLPIISTNVGVAKEIVRHSETGFIVRADPHTISDHITQLNDSATRKFFGENIQEKIKKDFAWDNIIQQYLDIYRSFH